MMDSGFSVMNQYMFRTFKALLAAVTAVGALLPMLPLAANSTVYERKWSQQELEAALEDSAIWLNSDIGREPIAPAPWTPMTVDGQSIGAWGKVYRYANSVLPVSMTSLG